MDGWIFSPWHKKYFGTFSPKWAPKSASGRPYAHATQFLRVKSLVFVSYSSTNAALWRASMKIGHRSRKSRFFCRRRSQAPRLCRSSTRTPVNLHVKLAGLVRPYGTWKIMVMPFYFSHVTMDGWIFWRRAKKQREDGRFFFCGSLAQIRRIHSAVGIASTARTLGVCTAAVYRLRPT